jgi:aminobenzoyl-glutamate utilization protein B
MKVTAKGKDFVVSWLEQHHKEFYGHADALWSFAELGCEEYFSSKLLIDLLKEHGFRVRAKVAGIPTAFLATWGEGRPRIGFNCEFDALPGLSQHPTRQRKPVLEGAPGHGCGHNLLGVGSVMAVVGVTNWLAKTRCSGTVVVIGAPAEELCVGKPYMARAGLFKGFDAIIDWHPAPWNSANYDTCNAYFSIKYHFRGHAAHGNAPWMGRSAMDSALLMGHAIELLREHIPPGHPDAANTVNYTFPDIGPEYPNVVPDRATVWVVGRITTTHEMEEVIRRIDRCAEASAWAGETSWERQLITATHERIPNRALSSLLYQNLVEIGPPRFETTEQQFAKSIQRNLGVEEVGLHEGIMDFREGSAGVTDNSEYSWFAPFAMLRVTAAPANIGWHNWPVVASVRTAVGKKAMNTASKVLAVSAVELFSQPQILEDAWKEFTERLAGRSYRSLIPAGVDPPIDINRETMEKYRHLMREHYPC